MAIILRADGTKTEVQPENGKTFDLQEVYKLLDIRMVELIHLDGIRILLCDEDGRLKADPEVNAAATRLYQMQYGPVDMFGNILDIVGNALLCLDKEFK